MELDHNNQIPIENYIKNNTDVSKLKDINISEDSDVSNKKTKKDKGYNFDDTLDYYMKREENFIVGIIDKNTNKLASQEDDLFKIRPPRDKVLDKKRGTGIPTLKGAVCSTSQSKPQLLKLFEKLPNVNKEEITKLKKITRENICTFVKSKLIYLEKYGTTSKNNKLTYVMVPINHPTLNFPLNLEDRVDYLIKKIEKSLSVSPNSLKKKADSFSKKLNLNIEKKNNGVFEDIKNLPTYTITLNNINEIKNSTSNELTNNGFTYDKKTNSWFNIIN